MNRSESNLRLSLALWACLIGFSYYALIAYSAVRGEQTRETKNIWPAESKILPSVDNFTLVIFIHPHCPCSRASLHELNKIMTSSHHNIDCKIVFFNPEEFESGWEKTDLWNIAQTVPNSFLLSDKNGKEAKIFKAFTSGQTMLFDRDGKMIYSGGITGSRGHEGDNLGGLAITNLAADKKSTTNCGPVFGCPLFEKTDGSVVVRK